MADPLGSFLSKLFAGWLGYRVAQNQSRARDDIDRLNDERINHTANVVYTRLYAMLSKAKIGGKGQSIPLADILGNAELSRFSLEVAEFVKRQLREQP